MKKIKLIACDLDGTLLNSNKQISPETLNAIKRATDAGKTVILCTGRNLAELNAFTEIIPGLRYLDCVSGACVYDLKEKKTLYSQALDPGIVKKLMEFGMEEGAMIHVLSERSIVQKDQQSHMADFHMGIYQTMFDQITDKLDAVGNTTAAMGKGFAIGSAALTGLALLASYVEEIKIGLLRLGETVLNFTDGRSIEISKASFSDFMVYYDVTLMNPKVLAGMFLGSMMAFMFCGLTMNAVGRAAGHMVEEVRRQFKEIKGILTGEAQPDYARCVEISTKGAQHEMVLPSVLAIIAPILTGLIFGVTGVVGLLIGGLSTGFVLAVFMANAGGAWDNAKKFIEEGNHGGKGSEAHKATVVGDTVGDPFKDTSGPRLNILIKLMSMVAIVMAGLTVAWSLF